MGQEGTPLGSAWLRAARRGGLHSAPPLDHLAWLWCGAGAVVSGGGPAFSASPRQPGPAVVQRQHSGV